ncbi:TonB-dependent receptor [Tamilnaduibacter salinus]|uniref:TonB-dependent receptor n=1 Tax=Tamilnaduibacter salinus TaxID=1484056 RepID=A0A2U1CY16_9GAMM|nr:TonB-dependent receptor [Tamilnaduibacter salinus]PVY77369.1 TonB-dependent receptor [Tamilnaduibacter salinus]
MRKPTPGLWSLLALMLLSQSAAASELLLYVFQNTSPVADVQVRLDGEATKTTGADGSATFELVQGQHRVVLEQGGSTLHQFRFSSGAGQNADVSVTLPTDDGETPQVAVETYNARENLSEREGEAVGLLAGTVSSQETGAVISGARVSVPGSDYAATTNAQGRFQLELPRGQYELQMAHPEYGNRTIDSVRVVANVTREARYTMSLSGDGGAVEEVVATGSYIPDTASEQQRSAESVLDVIGTEQLARFGDSNAAEAVKRSVGVNVSDGKFVFVRGLGGRYNTTTLNGASLPSTDPSRRTTPLDLFPAGVLDQVEVRKAFTPDMPGDSSAGNVQLQTRSFPDEPFFKISGSLGGNTRITGDDVITDPADGDFDAFGFDDGTRELPALVDGATAFGRVDPSATNGFPPALVELMGQLFEPTLAPETSTAYPDGKFGLSGGTSFERGENLYGIYAAATYKSGWDVKDEGEQNTYKFVGGSLNQNDDFTFFEAERNVEIGGMVTLGAELGLDHTLEATTLVSRKTENSARVEEGVGGENGLEIKEYTFDYEERQFFSQQFAGEHYFPSARNLKAEWQYTYSQADRYAPDRRTVRFDDDKSTSDALVFNDSGFERRYADLTDENNDLSADLTLPVAQDSMMPTDLKGGVQIIRRDRDSETARFSYDYLGSISDEGAVINQDPTPNANEVLSPGNIGPDAFTLRNNTAPSDRYDASLDLNAGYLMADSDIGADFRVVAGARVEQAEQTVNTFDNSEDPVEGGFDQTDVLPSLNGTWYMNPDMQIRAGYSQTVSRPDFKETANATFFDPVFGFTVRGNPDLEIAEIDNFDLRWEYYLSSTETLTVGAFYKDITAPIERVLIPSGGSGGGVRSYDNAESGEIQGIEVDVRKEFALDDSFSQTVFVQVNGALIDSEVTLPEGTSESSRTRKLQGQADYTFNLATGYDHLDSGQKVTLLFNRNGESIEDAGRGALPKVIEEPMNQVDLTYEKTFTADLVMNLKVENLLDAEKEFTQGGETYFSYYPGVSVSVGADWTF